MFVSSSSTRGTGGRPSACGSGTNSSRSWPTTSPWPSASWRSATYVREDIGGSRCSCGNRELRNVAVDASSQGRGLGTAAVRAVIARASRPDSDCTELAASAHPDNAAAHRSSRAAGLHWDGELRNGEPLMRVRVDRIDLAVRGLGATEDD